MFGKPKRERDTSAEELRIRQLELELQVRKELTAAAEKEIERCRKVYDAERTTIKVLGGIVSGALLLFGSFFGIKSFSEIKKAADELKTATGAKLTNDLVQLRREIDAVISTQVVNIQTAVKQDINKQFETTAISNLVTEAAKARIASIADLLISSNVVEHIEPVKAQLIEELAKAKLDVLDARKNVAILTTQFESLNPENQILSSVTADVRIVCHSHEDIDFELDSSDAILEAANGFTLVILARSDIGGYTVKNDASGTKSDKVQMIRYDAPPSAFAMFRHLKLADRMSASNLVLRIQRDIPKGTVDVKVSVYWNNLIRSFCQVTNCTFSTKDGASELRLPLLHTFEPSWHLENGRFVQSWPGATNRNTLSE
jgi:hypothetical protein